ncbi:HigA family addiction module antitoxin [Pusillimonas caeni]|uniref:HigA family addiction module antitoxin n=1 Tax=Pusillimonas caeni TaxID=1348472 RepID=UPI000E59E3C1
MYIEISELADAMSVHRNTLSRIVHDKGTLTAPMAIKLAAALGDTPELTFPRPSTQPPARDPVL